MEGIESGPGMRWALVVGLLAGLVGWYPGGQGSVAAVLIGLWALRAIEWEGAARIWLVVAGACVVIGSLGLVYPLTLIFRVTACQSFDRPFLALLAVLAPAVVAAPLVWLAMSSLLRAWIRAIAIPLLALAEVAGVGAALFVVIVMKISDC